MIFLIILALVSSTQALRIGLLNDIHLDLSYRFSCNDALCLDKGFYLKDPPASLLQTILDDMVEQYPERREGSSQSQALDLLIVSGDLVVHGLSSDDPTKNQWPEMKETISEVGRLVSEAYPETPILFSIGNNDVMYHYKAPNETDKQLYYGDVFKMWFEDIPANKELFDLEEVKETFLEGGYFKYQHSEELSFFSLNSILVNYKNHEDLSQAEAMLDWLEEELSHVKKAIIFMHIPPAIIALDSSPVQMWDEQFLERYLGIMDKYQEKVLIVLGSHVHAQDIKAPEAKDSHSVNLIELVTAAITPGSLNNPTYTIMELSDSTEITKVTWRSLQLYSYILRRKISFTDINPQRLFKVDFSEMESVREMEERLGEDGNEFIKYAVAIMGYPWIVQEIAQKILPHFQFLQQLQKSYVCGMQSYFMADFYDCMAAA